MTLEQFKNIDPGDEYILLYYTTEPDTVSAINIHTTDCDGKNITEVLDELSELSINVNGTLTTFVVVNKQIYTGYYHLLVQDKEVTGISSVVEGVCELVYTKPPYLGTRFNKSEYQAIQNNASDNRTTNLIFDVDRNSSQLSPSNYQAIISGTAPLAQYQELNYTSIGITNSRYAGSKTSTEDYGVNSALGVKTFSGDMYLTSIDTNYICSQSLSDRNLQELAYIGNEDFPTSGSRIFTLNGNRPLPIRNRKIWVQTNNKIIESDGEGYIASSGTLCSI